jgi:hypothetical protein
MLQIISKKYALQNWKHIVKFCPLICIFIAFKFYSEEALQPKNISVLLVYNLYSVSTELQYPARGALYWTSDLN